MNLPWVSRRAYDDAIALVRLREQELIAHQRRYQDMIEKFSAQLTGMVKEGYRTPETVVKHPPFEPDRDVSEAIAEIAGHDGFLKKRLVSYAFHNRHRPSKDVADEIRRGE